MQATAMFVRTETAQIELRAEFFYSFKSVYLEPELAP